MEPEKLARIFSLPLSQLGRRFVLAEVLGKPVALRRKPPPRKPPPPSSPAPK